MLQNQNVQTIDQFLSYLILLKVWKDLCITEKKEIIFSLQFGFGQKYSTTHALLHLIDIIRHKIDKGNCACGIFVDFQKVFDTEDHHILLKKQEYYGARGTSNKWLASYLTNRN